MKNLVKVFKVIIEEPEVIGYGILVIGLITIIVLDILGIKPN